MFGFMKVVAKSAYVIGGLVALVLAAVVSLSVFAFTHRNDHAILHALEQREVARINAAREQQQRQQAAQPRPAQAPPVAAPAPVEAK